MSAVLLKELDAKLVTDMMIRWKSLYSEFKTIAILEGLGKVYLSTITTIHSLQTSGVLKECGAGNMTISTNKEHEKKETEFLKQHAFKCWSAVVEIPRLVPIEKILEPDELVVEFIQIGKYDETELRAFLEMYVLTILPNGERELVSIDFTVCNQRVKEWLKEWNTYTAEGIYNPSSEAVKDLDKAGKELSSVLFPSSVQQKIRQPMVKHVYLCLEPYNTLPIHLLPGEDGLLLFADCTVSHVNACRELLRECAIKMLAQESPPKPSSPSHIEEDQKLKDDGVSLPHSTPHPQAHEIKEHIDSTSISSVCERNTEQPTPPSTIPSNDCYIFAHPNYDLALLVPSSGDTSTIKQFLDLFIEKLSLSEVQRCEPLPSSHSEACMIRDIVHNSHPTLNVHMKNDDAATLDSVFELSSPLFVHFSTHGFGHFGLKVSESPTIWDDTYSGLALAGFNTYRAQKFTHVDPRASTGILTPLAIYGLNLKGTHLVFLSTCVSAVGVSVLLESANSLANAFRVAGVLTVIATIWSIPDDPTVHFVKHFYNKILQPGVRPSEALKSAQHELCKDPHYSHLQNWAGFVCYGDDIPLFPR